jgi:hypothetical protein
MSQLRQIPVMLVVLFALLLACRVAAPVATPTMSPTPEQPVAVTNAAPRERPTSLPPATPTNVPTVAYTRAPTGCYFAPYGIGGGVEVYAAPDFDSQQLGTVVMGERLPVLDLGGEWKLPPSPVIRHFYQIQLDEETAGWVAETRGDLEGSCAAFHQRTAVAIAETPAPRPAAPADASSALYEIPADAEPLPPLPGMIYQEATGLWLVEGTENRRQLSEQSGLKLSPDGKRGLHIVDGDVWIHTLSSGERINITAGSGRTHIYAAWWPARPDTIVLSSWDEVDAGPNHGRLTLLNDDGSNYRIIQEEGGLSGSPPAPSPDGQSIAFDMGLKGMVYRKGQGIFPFGPGSFALPEGVQILRMGSPSWSPDGERLAWMMAVTGGGYGQGESWDIVLGVFDLRSRDVILIHPYQPVGRGGWLPPATWSTDGQWLTFSVESTDENERGLWVTAADGSSEQRLSPVSNSPVIWSPPGDEAWANGRSLILVLPYWKEEGEVRLVESGSWRQARLALPVINAVDWRQLPMLSDEFGIYLLADDRPATALAEEELQTVALQERLLIGASDIVSYDRDSHAMQLTEAAFRRVQELFPLPVRVDGIPFVVRVGDERIYAGAFWTPLSSLSYDGVVILQPMGEPDRAVGLALGYPSPEAFSGDDPRADPRIIEALERAGKVR